MLGLYLKVSRDHGYTAQLTNFNPFQGHFCVELSKDGIVGSDVYGSVMQSVDASQYRGRKVKFRAAVRAEISG